MPKAKPTMRDKIAAYAIQAGPLAPDELRRSYELATWNRPMGKGAGAVTHLKKAMDDLLLMGLLQVVHPAWLQDEPKRELTAMFADFGFTVTHVQRIEAADAITWTVQVEGEDRPAFVTLPRDKVGLWRIYGHFQALLARRTQQGVKA